MTETAPPADWLAALWASHERLRDAVGALSLEEIRAPSYDDEWSIADVFSHLGSGAEIFSAFLATGRGTDAVADLDSAPAVWAAWNEKDPERQVLDSLAVNQALLEAVDALSEHERLAWSLEFFGERRGIGDLLWFRLSEHALHTWDVLVALDATATLTSSSVNLLIDVLGSFAPRVAKGLGHEFDARLSTSQPARSFELRADGQTVSLESTSTAEDPMIELPAEALIRLVYGRLDPAHTPPVTGDGTLLDEWREIFTGL